MDGIKQIFNDKGGTLEMKGKMERKPWKKMERKPWEKNGEETVENKNGMRAYEQRNSDKIK